MNIKTAERNSGILPEDNVIHHRHMIAYQEAIPYISGRVLEIGSGQGYGLKILAPKAQSYVAVDKFETPLESNNTNVQFIRMKVPPLVGLSDNDFDIVVCFQVIEHIKKDRLFLEEICRVLKPGGVLILTTPNINMSLTRNPWHVREYDLNQIKKLLSEVFSVFEIKGVYGNEKVMSYYEENKKSVKRFTRYDVLNLQYILPRFLLKIPYDIANRMNRNKLLESNNTLVNAVVTSDFFIENADEKCFDFFVIAKK